LNCSGFTARATMASISSSLGQMSLSCTALPALIVSQSCSMLKRMVPAIA